MINSEYLNIRVSKSERKSLALKAKKKGFTYERFGKKVENVSGYIRSLIQKDLEVK